LNSFDQVGERPREPVAFPHRQYIPLSGECEGVAKPWPIGPSPGCPIGEGAFAPGSLEGINLNRVLHLLDDIDFRKATRDAMTCMEKGAYFCVSARSSDDFNAALMEWIPGKDQQVARYKDPARNGHDITFVTKDRLLRVVGNDLEDIHYTKAREPERVGSPDTHLLILIGRKQGWVSDAVMPTVGSNLAPDTANPRTL
jgi:hypothetical protein